MESTFFINQHDTKKEELFLWNNSDMISSREVTATTVGLGYTSASLRSQCKVILYIFHFIFSIYNFPLKTTVVATTSLG